MLELSVTCLAYALAGEGNTYAQKERIAAVIINSAGSVDKICDEVYKPHRYEFIYKMTHNQAAIPTRARVLKNKLIAIKIINSKSYLKYKYHHFHDDRISNPWHFRPQEKIDNLTFY